MTAYLNTCVSYFLISFPFGLDLLVHLSNCCLIFLRNNFIQACYNINIWFYTFYGNSLKSLIC